jgi:hypothetical protein
MRDGRTTRKAGAIAAARRHETRPQSVTATAELPVGRHEASSRQVSQGADKPLPCTLPVSANSTGVLPAPMLPLQLLGPVAAPLETGTGTGLLPPMLPAASLPLPGINSWLPYLQMSLMSGMASYPGSYSSTPASWPAMLAQAAQAQHHQQQQQLHGPLHRAYGAYLGMQMYQTQGVGSRW